jgi:site-specific recombinase XerD
MFLTTYAVDLIRKYKDHPECAITGAVLPRRSLKELNAQLKVLAGMANIPISLSSHIARHTFRQLLGEAGVQDFAVVKRMMGL